jgi:hypothetical protein
MSETIFRQVPEITEQYSVAAFPTTFIFKVNEYNAVLLNQLPTLFQDFSAGLRRKKNILSK